MRHYSIIVPSFWTGMTGKAITLAGKNTRIVATYVLTNEHANMLGVYRLPLLYLAEETGLKRREVSVALEHLEAIDFAHYDEVTEFIWIPEMARFQLQLNPGECLKENDKRSNGAARLYKQIAPNPFLGPFYDRYSLILGLPIRRYFLAETKPHPSPFEGASVPLARGYVPVPDPVSDRKGDTGETKLSASPHPQLTIDEIQERWNLLPGVRLCKEISKQIRDQIQARLKEHPTSEWWDGLFQRVQAADFLCGRVNGRKGPFYASLGWVLAPKILGKILAGDYDPIVRNDHGVSGLCTKRIRFPGEQLFRACKKPASPESRPNEPRCAEHLAQVSQTGGLSC